MPLKKYITPDEYRTSLLIGEEGEEPVDHDLVVQFYYTPGRPGKVSGPPEYCYPEEPEEITIEGIFDDEGNSLEHLVPESSFEKLEQKILDHVHSEMETAKEEAAIARAEDKLFDRRF